MKIFKNYKSKLKNTLSRWTDYLFDSKLLHEIQTYVGGKRTDLNGNEIHGSYPLVKELVDNALDSVKWLKDLGVKFDDSQVTMPVGALWRRDISLLNLWDMPIFMFWAIGLMRMVRQF